MKICRLVGPFILGAALLAMGCHRSAPQPTPIPWHQPTPVGAVSPGQFHVIPFGYNPSVSGWPGAVGDIVQNAGSTSAWVRNGTADTAWQTFPGGSSGTLVGPVVGSTTASIAVTGLSGETDGDYEGVVHIVASSLSGAPDLQFLPNGVTGTSSSFDNQQYSGGSLPASAAYLTLGQSYTSNDTIDVYFRISSKKSAARHFQ